MIFCQKIRSRIFSKIFPRKRGLILASDYCLAVGCGDYGTVLHKSSIITAKVIFRGNNKSRINCRLITSTSMVNCVTYSPIYSHNWSLTRTPSYRTNIGWFLMLLRSQLNHTPHIRAFCTGFVINFLESEIFFVFLRIFSSELKKWKIKAGLMSNQVSSYWTQSCQSMHQEWRLLLPLR